MSYTILPRIGGSGLEGHLLMSKKERDRKGVFEMVRRGLWTLVDAADHLDLCYRQCRRSYKRYLLEGDAGLIHKSRGQPSNRSKNPEMRETVIRRYEESYEGFGPTLAAEKLEAEGFKVDHETLRRWLIAEGKWKRHRRRSQHRQRRERREHFGELVQMDGSFHHWFGPEHPEYCLIDLIDDATGIRMSLMAEEETTEACMRALWEWIERYGVPKALYVDKKNVFITKREATLEEQLAGEEPKTTFGKACDKLDIEIIPANSPQAKGRVERAHGVNQDRLVKELKLQGVTTIEGANELLVGGFVENLNQKFAMQPTREEDFHRPVPRGVKLSEVFCYEESRTIDNNWVVRYQNRIFQIGKENYPLPRPKQKVTVQKLLDGSIRLLYAGQRLKYQEIELGAVKVSTEKKVALSKQVAPKPINKPAADHPWRWSKLHKAGKASAKNRR